MTTTTDTAPGVAQPRLRNRRVTIRYRCAPATLGKVFVSEDEEFQRAWVDNLSRGGVGMYLSRAVPIGAPIMLQMKSILEGAVHELAGQVVHFAPKEPYGWYLAVEFYEPLTDEVLDSLL